MNLEIVDADLAREDHAEATVALLDDYSKNPGANGHGLPESTRRDLVPGLRAHPGTHVFLAYQDGAPVGIAVCFLGFSTFAARPLLNVHDLSVRQERRGAGVGRALMVRVEERARQLGCCKITLEVQDNNRPAKHLYEKLGFAAYELASDAGPAIFWQKKLA